MTLGSRRLLTAVLSAAALSGSRDGPGRGRRAQTSETAAEARRKGQRICVGARYLARAEPERLAQHRAVPVPASFRQPRTNPTTFACDGVSIERLFVDWHLSFGSERSVAAALAYLAEHTLTPIPPPERYTPEITRAWRASHPELQRALGSWHKGSAIKEAARRLLEQNRAYRRLDQLLEDRDKYHFFADQYLRAAAAFKSLDLLAGADRYIRAAVNSAGFLGPLLRFQPTLRVDQLHFNLDMHVTDAQRMFAANLRAHITRTPQNIAAAERCSPS